MNESVGVNQIRKKMNGGSWIWLGSENEIIPFEKFNVDKWVKKFESFRHNKRITAIKSLSQAKWISEGMNRFDKSNDIKSNKSSSYHEWYQASKITYL